MFALGQVSWLAVRCSVAQRWPSPAPCLVRSDRLRRHRRRTAYSCGHSSGVGARRAVTGFPFSSAERTRSAAAEPEAEGKEQVGKVEVASIGDNRRAVKKGWRA